MAVYQTPMFLGSDALEKILNETGDITFKPVSMYFTFYVPKTFFKRSKHIEKSASNRKRKRIFYWR